MFRAFDKTSEIAKTLKDIGKNRAKFHLPEAPEAIVIFSAHWESEGRNDVEILVNSNSELFYDYYGFPSEAYELKYNAPSASVQFAERVKGLINSEKNEGGLKATIVENRGWDHGVFIPMLILYPEARIPILQISLNDKLDARQHIALGRSLKSLRKENVFFVGSGQITHPMMSKDGKVKDLVNPFLERLHSAITSNVETQQEKDEQIIAAISPDKLTMAMHSPRLEHLLPLAIVYGLSDFKNDQPVELLGSVPGKNDLRFLNGVFSVASYLFQEKNQTKEKHGEL